MNKQTKKLIKAKLRIFIEKDKELQTFLETGLMQKRRSLIVESKAKDKKFSNANKAVVQLIKIIQNLDAFVLEDQQKATHLKQLDRIKWDIRDNLQEYKDNDSDFKLKLKHLKIPNSNGLFTSIGLIGAKEAGYCYLENVTCFSSLFSDPPIINKDPRSKEVFYISRYATLQKHQFLKFSGNRKFINSFASRLMNLGKNDLENSLNNLLNNYLKKDSRFGLLPYPDAIKFEVHNNGIYNKKGNLMEKWKPFEQ